MSLPNRSTKLKVAFGYILLTALLFISIGYIYQEMKSLTGTSAVSYTHLTLPTNSRA